MPKLSREQHLQFAAQVLETQVFGAFWLAIEARRKESGLTQSLLVERTGRDKTNISKLLDKPRNWTLKTISDLAEALGVQVEVALKDKENSTRIFTPTGVRWEPVFAVPCFSDVIDYTVPTMPTITASNTSTMPYPQLLVISQNPAGFARVSL
jgi:hypothetical protein